jgi:hypothetical protein
MTYKVTGVSAFCKPLIYTNLSKEEAQDIYRELKFDQYLVTMEEEDDEILGLTPNYDY